jgi:sulfur carrier protein
MSESHEARVRVNGQEEGLTASTVAGLLEKRDIPVHMRGIAVALNGRVVPRGEWSETTLAPGDSLEIVMARQGG